MSHHEKPNTINTPETAERLADPIVSREVADTAIDAVTSDPTPDELSLEEQAESLVAGLSYEGQAFSSPADLMKTHKNPRAVRAFIESRRSDPTMDAMYHLADEIWLRNSGKKSRNSARSDEYLQTLIDGYQHSEAIEVSDAVDSPDAPETPGVSPEPDQPSGNVQPAINTTPVDETTPAAQLNTTSPNQPAASTTAPVNTAPTPPVPTPPSPTPPAAPTTRKSKSSSPAPQPVIRVNPVDRPTTEASANETIGTQPETREQAAGEVIDRQARIDALLSPKLSKREIKKEIERERYQQVCADTKTLTDYLNGLDIPEAHTAVIKKLTTYARKVDPQQLSRLSRMAYVLQSAHDTHSTPERQREAIDNVLFSEDGLLLKMFVANGIDYDALTPQELHNIVFSAEAHITLRDSRIANMGKVATVFTELGSMAALGGQLWVSTVPLTRHPLRNLLYGHADAGILGRENRQRHTAIAHLDKAAAEKYATLRSSTTTI